MHYNHYRSSCCVDPDAIPPQYKCLIPAICRGFEKLRKRHKQLSTKRKRIVRLAQPVERKRLSKYRTPCLCPEALPWKAYIVRLEGLAPTRTDQLAYPPAERIECLIKETPAYQSFLDIRKLRIRRLLRQSRLSLYAHLKRCRPVEEPKKRKPMTEFEKAESVRRINKLSKPITRGEKIIPVGKHAKSAAANITTPKAAAAPKTGQSKGGYYFKSMRKENLSISSDESLKKLGNEKSLRHLKMLAMPRIYEDTSAPPWRLTPQLANYRPTERLNKLAQPRPPDHHDPRLAYTVKRNALHYKVTERTKELARPGQYKYVNRLDTHENPFMISPRALKAKATPRLIELAEPRDHIDTSTRADAFKVSPKALKAKITPRLLELSKPKQYATA